MRQIKNETAGCCATCERASHDFCARLGGDEFALVLTKIDDVDDVPPIAERLLGALASPYHLKHGPVDVTASVGIAAASADPASDDLLRLADRAMYSAKQQGKNAWVLQDQHLPARTTDEVSPLPGQAVRR